MVEAVAPVGGKVLKVFPHAYVIVAAEGFGVLVHLGIDTVQLAGEGFTVHVEQGADVVAGQLVVTYDVPAVEALGRNPIVPVVALEKPAEALVLDGVFGAGGPLAALDTMFTVR